MSQTTTPQGVIVDVKTPVHWVYHKIDTHHVGGFDAREVLRWVLNPKGALAHLRSGETIPLSFDEFKALQAALLSLPTP